MITGRVVQVIDTKRVILNIGKSSGVQPGMRFGIYTPEMSVRDPETQEELGIYRELKTTVDVDDAYDRFSIASAPAHVRMRTAFETWGRLFASTPGELPIRPEDIDPLPTGSTVKAGDLVEQLPTEEEDEEALSTETEGASETLDGDEATDASETKPGL